MVQRFSFGLIIASLLLRVRSVTGQKAIHNQTTLNSQCPDSVFFYHFIHVYPQLGQPPCYQGCQLLSADLGRCKEKGSLSLSLNLSSASKIFTWQNILADQGFCGWAEGGWKGVALFMTKLLGNSSSGNLSSGNAAMKWRKSAPQSQGHLVTMGVTIQKNIFAHFKIYQK